MTEDQEREDTARAALLAHAGDYDEQKRQADFYSRRCNALQKWQSRMRDPERTVVCDILANGNTLPPEIAGNRYAAQADRAVRGVPVETTEVPVPEPDLLIRGFRDVAVHSKTLIRAYGDAREAAGYAAGVAAGWKGAAIAWEVCASIHREYAKKKDPFFTTRQSDFVKHAEAARAKALTPEPDMAERDDLIADNERLMQIAAQEVSAAEVPMPEHVEQLAITRYRPVPNGMFGYKVVAGDGTRSVFEGTKSECTLIARKLTEAFLDGAHVAGDAREAAGYARGLAEPGGALESAQQRAEYWKSECCAANAEIDKLCADLAASQAECERMRIPIGWKPAPFEPTAEMLDVAVSHALTVQISGEYNWSAYMRDVWMRMWSQIGAQSIPRAALAGEVKP